MDAPEKLRDEALAKGIARVAQRVQQALADLDRDGRLVRLAGREIPDARARLAHVVHMTEAAAHRTLDLVEQAREAIDGLEHGDLRPALDPVTRRVLGTVRADLSALAQAQEYQDLSGQLIARVIALVGEIETALQELLHSGGWDLKFAPPAPITPLQATLPGPAVPGVEARAASQQDADALLADLGF